MTKQAAQQATENTEVFDMSDFLDGAPIGGENIVEGDRGDSLMSDEAPAAVAPVAPVEPVVVPEPKEPADEQKVVKAKEPAEDKTPAAESEPENKADPDRIPYARFKQSRDQLATAKARIAELEAAGATQQQAATQVATQQTKGLDISASELQAIAGKILDGDTEGFATSMAQMLQNVHASARDEGAQAATMKFEQAASAKQGEAFNNRLEGYRMNIPQMDESSESYDEEFDQMTAAKVTYLVQNKGMGMTEALDQAVDQMAKQYGYLESDTPVEKVVAPKTDTRTQAQVKKNVATAGKQPPRMGSERSELGDADGSATVDISKMTDAEFDAMAETQLAILRGDIVA